MKLKALALAVFMSTTIADAQMVDFAVQVVDYFADEKVEIVDYFADRKICITNAEELDRDLLERLGLIN